MALMEGRTEIFSGVGRRRRPIWWAAATGSALIAIGFVFRRPASENEFDSAVRDPHTAATNEGANSIKNSRQAHDDDDLVRLQFTKSSEPVPDPNLKRLSQILESSLHGFKLDGKSLSLEALSLAIVNAELPAALGLLEQNEFARPGQELRELLLKRWVVLDPKAATAWVDRLPPGPSKAGAVQSLASGWASDNWQAAWSWANDLSADSEKQLALLQVGYELAKIEPVRALTLAIGLTPGASRDDLLDYSASLWASRNPDDATQWAKQIPDEILRQRMLSQILTAWGDRDPAAAANMAAQSLAPGRPLDDAVVSIVQRWAQTDPVAAGAWVRRFPESDLRETASQELVKLWVDKAPKQVELWLGSLETGSERDSAVAAYATKIFPTAPKTAAAWVASIGDEARRLTELQHLGESWLQTDTVGARNWLKTAPISDELKAQILTGGSGSSAKPTEVLPP